MTIPAHYSAVMPYLVVSDAEAFIKFIENVFGAEEKLRVNMDDGSVMHCEYSINGGTIMFGQAGGEWKPFPCGMFVVVDDVRALYERGLANGATGNQEPADRGYGLAAGMIDAWGNQWWLNDPETRG
jgi:PhnB protein